MSHVCVRKEAGDVARMTSSNKEGVCVVSVSHHRKETA
jgi:hypothetical protein